ncbi:MAG TPA: stress-induced protein [Verrucomicrobiae bacterium]|nr:stress-induced protein [Verrucomicrobiae bacterium]
MANGTSNRGLGSSKMSPEKKHEIQSKGGKSQGKQNNPANFTNDRKKAKAAGQEGGEK